MMAWKCLECDSINTVDEIVRCPCGFEGEIATYTMMHPVDKEETSSTIPTKGKD